MSIANKRNIPPPPPSQPHKPSPPKVGYPQHNLQIEAIKSIQNKHDQLLNALQIQFSSLRNDDDNNKDMMADELTKLGTEVTSMKRQIKYLTAQMELFKRQHEEFQEQHSRDLNKIKDIVIDIMFSQRAKFTKQEDGEDIISESSPLTEVKRDKLGSEPSRKPKLTSSTPSIERPDICDSIKRYNSDKVRRENCITGEIASVLTEFSTGKPISNSIATDIPSRRGSKKEAKYMSAPSSYTNTFNEEYIVDAFAEALNTPSDTGALNHVSDIPNSTNSGTSSPRSSRKSHHDPQRVSSERNLSRNSSQRTIPGKPITSSNYFALK